MFAIRSITGEDLPKVEATFPEGGLEKHAERLERQNQGRVDYLIAWEGETAAGHGLLNWAGSGDEHVRRQLHAPCPDVEDVYVHTSLRGLGIGSQILEEAERRAAEKGFGWIGLSVDAEGNPGARRLYERKGYRDAGFGIYVEHGEYLDPAGNRETWEEDCIYLLKKLEVSE